MKKILIIGVSGSLGKGVVKEIKAEYEVTGTYASQPFSMDGIKTQRLDVTVRSDFDSLAKDFDAVFLVAGAMPAMMKGYSPQQYIDVNITGVMIVTNTNITTFTPLRTEITSQFPITRV